VFIVGVAKMATIVTNATKDTVKTTSQNIFVLVIQRYELILYLQSACFRYHHSRCKGSKGCECECHNSKERLEDA